MPVVKWVTNWVVSTALLPPPPPPTTSTLFFVLLLMLAESARVALRLAFRACFPLGAVNVHEEKA